MPARAKRGRNMAELIRLAKEEEELFWLGQGFDSSDGERDEDFNSEDDDREELVDSDLEEITLSKRQKRKD